MCQNPVKKAKIPPPGALPAGITAENGVLQQKHSRKLQKNVEFYLEMRTKWDYNDKL